jgi:TetR/AcrR family transcriptional regulator, transcriptional repressor for nem operon
MILRTLRNDRLRCLSACAPSSMRGSSISVGSVWRNGCLIGDFSAEASAHSEVIRKRLVEIYEEMRQSGRVLLESRGEDWRGAAED